MERRAGSHTEEEEMNQRRRLLNLAKKGDEKAINRLFELYQVRVYSGPTLSKAKRLPVMMVSEKKRPTGTKSQPKPTMSSSKRGSGRKSVKTSRKHK